jgi:hypothetical protein
VTDKTDYLPGDEPVPVGTQVFYQGSAAAPGVYEVTDHMEPYLKPDWGMQNIPLNEIYPDGTGYGLWPVGVARKFGNSHLSVLWARRTSFRIYTDEGFSHGG